MQGSGKGGEQRPTISRRLPMASAEETRFLVHIANRAEIATDDLKVGVLPDIVLGHFEHAKMEVGDWAEGTTSDEDYGSFVWVIEGGGDTVVRKGIIFRVCEGLCEMRGGGHRIEKKRKEEERS